MPTRQWDERSFFAELAQVSDEATCNVARQLCEWCDREGYTVVYGQGATEGTLAPAVMHENRVCKLFEVFTRHLGKPGCVLLASYLWRNKYWTDSPFGEEDKRRQLIAKLNRIPLNKPLPVDAEDGRPWLTLDTLGNPDTFKTFTDVHDWVAQEIRRSPR